MKSNLNCFKSLLSNLTIKNKKFLYCEYYLINNKHNFQNKMR